MCGIAGYIGKRRRDDEHVRRCLTAMHHRGPDDRGIRMWVREDDTVVQLLHSRLRIIDLDPRANQPFNVDAKWIIFNGELYNYLEIRDRLLGRGWRLRTESDTEVLLAAVQEFGWQILDEFEGMWAFAVYDEKDGSLTLCRDRFGEKPLYLYWEDGDLYFGSEVKFIFELLGKRLPIDYNHLRRFLVNGYRAINKVADTFFKGLRELPSATLLRLDCDGGNDTRKYWSPAIGPDDGMTYEEAVCGAREHVLRAMELRLRADVPLAFCMSGGIDSNSLICSAKRVFGYDVHGFTIVNTDERYDEQEMVDRVVGALQLRHTSVPIQQDGFLKNLRKLVRHHDGPVYTISYYVHWMLQQSIAENGYRVAISGTGADELFSGYYDHQNAYLYEVRRDPEIFESALADWIRHVQPIVRNPFLTNASVFIDQPELRDHLYLDASAFAGLLHGDWSEPFYECRYADGLLRNRMLNELFHESVPQILHEDDLNAMFYSIENRSPFLDRRLFDFCGRIPTRYLIRDARAKAVLRDAMRGLVPQEVLDNRKKVGFNAPILDLLDSTDPAVRCELLGESPIYDVVRREGIVDLLDKTHLPNSESKFLFYFLNAKIFLEEFAA